MRILIDIGHPAHVHLFKHFAFEMQRKGHSFFFTVREGENERILLEGYGFKNKVIGSKRKTRIGKILGLIYFTIKILSAARKFEPDLFLSHGSMYAGLASFILRKPHIALEDSGNMEQIRLSKPVSSVILSPDILPLDLGCRHLKYKGYHEIAYLHPKYFVTDKTIFREMGLNENESYSILRFTSWNASHDRGQSGFTLDQKVSLVNELQKHLKVFITSEANLPKELEHYKISLHPMKMHQILAHAALVISEGATIASEAGVLGVPSLYVNSIVRYYNEDQANYGTVFNFRNGIGVLEKAMEIIKDDNYRIKAWNGKEKLLNDKIDVTSFLVWFIENYPDSFKIMRENPDYQYRFK